MTDSAKYVRPAAIGAYDLVVFDRCHPADEKALPRANTYFIDDVPPPWSKPTTPKLPPTRPLNATSDHPLMATLTGLNNIVIKDAFRFELSPDLYGAIHLKELQGLFSDPNVVPATAKDDPQLQPEVLLKKYDEDHRGYLNRGEFKRLWKEVEAHVENQETRPDAKELFVRVDTAKVPGVPERVPRLLEIGGTEAVLFALSRKDGYTDLVQAFPLVDEEKWTEQDWETHISFPTFLRNVVYQLGGVIDSATEKTLQPGQTEEIRPDAVGRDVDPAAAGPRTVQVWSAAAHKSLPAAPTLGNAFAYKDTEDIGAYLATWEGGRRGFAVNLLDENESDVRPRDEIKIGAEVLKATAAPYHCEPIDLWPFAAAAALLLLLVEWALYHFRVFG